MWYGISQNGGYHKITDEKDCLQPDAELVFEAEMDSLEGLLLRCTRARHTGLSYKGKMVFPIIEIEIGEKHYVFD